MRSRAFFIATVVLLALGLAAPAAGARPAEQRAWRDAPSIVALECHGRGTTLPADFPHRISVDDQGARISAIRDWQEGGTSPYRVMVVRIETRLDPWDTNSPPVVHQRPGPPEHQLHYCNGRHYHYPSAWLFVPGYPAK